LMRLQSMHVGMKVRHPDYGVGTVKSVSEHLADIRFDSGLRTLAPDQCDLQPADAQADLSGMSVPLSTLITETVAATIQELGLKRDDSADGKIGGRWHNGTVILRPSDPSLQSKEVPLEVFFHKIVMLRNNLRVLEQKINAHEKLSDAEKVEMQQYITRCYGSMTTFNVLFKEKQDQF
jgi:hypothetical protein